MLARSFLSPTARIISIAARNDIERTHQKSAYFSFRDKSGIELIQYDSIVRFEASSNYTLIHLMDGTHRVLSRPLKFVASLVCPTRFVRVHQSHLVAIKEIHRLESVAIILRQGLRLPLARRRKVSVLSQLQLSR